MNLTLLMTWDIRPDMEQDYFTFVMGEWVPAVQDIGLRLAAAWFTYYRKDYTVPSIRVELLAESEEEMRDALTNERWKELQRDLRAYVRNYTQKVVETTGDYRL